MLTRLTTTDRKQIEKAVQSLAQGKVIAYPTEAVYGLGCNPFDASAVQKLLALKARSRNKGLILLFGSEQQIYPWIEYLPARIQKKIFRTWPKATTWVIPDHMQCPSWIKGKHKSLAVRVTAHPLAKQLCNRWQRPIISTSANLSGFHPAKTALEVKEHFKDEIDFIVSGETGSQDKPTPIIDALSGRFLRR